MKTVKTTMRKLLFVSVLSIVQISWAGPLGTLFLTDGDNSTNVAITGTTVTTFAQATNTDTGGAGDEYAIAVPSTIRTLGNGNQGGSGTQEFSGSEYQLDGTPTGVTYAYPLSTGGDFYDGGTDGVNNFSVDYSTGNVYDFGLDWSNPGYLFTTQSGDLGITYDPVNQSLWISGYAGTDVSDYSLTGTLLSSFTAAAPVFGLAMDYTDDTLWRTDRARCTSTAAPAAN